MSRQYGMSIEVHKITAEEFESVKAVIESEWDEGDPFYNKTTNTLSTYAEGSLAGGETEKEFVTRLSRAIWTELKRFVEVTVGATYLEDLPFESYTADEDDYEQFKKG